MTKDLQNIDIMQFQQDLLAWYGENKRDLPWRRTKDPYCIWVSEIMLQQTQVDTVIPYYNNFMEKFPTVKDLAEADEQTVLKEWEGLGYYSRARNMHHAAKEMVASYNGSVPGDAEELDKLKGIGPYTKGAILSIAFDEPEPAVDGNVLRVLSRILNISDNISENKVKKQFRKYMEELISSYDPSSFNQAMMELGALICTPKEPMCMFCPVQDHCISYHEGTQRSLPVKSKAAKQKRIPYAVLIIQQPDGKVAIEKRPDKGLLANLWQFPMVPLQDIGLDHAASWIHQEYGLDIKIGKKADELTHVFSHLIWELTVYHADLVGRQDKDARLHWVDQAQIQDYPFPVSHQKMMEFLV